MLVAYEARRHPNTDGTMRVEEIFCQHISTTCHRYSSLGADNLVDKWLTLLVMSNDASFQSFYLQSLGKSYTFVALNLYFKSHISI